VRQPTQPLITPNSKVKKMFNLEASNVIALERPAAHAAEKTDVLRKLAEQVRNHSRSSTKAIIAIGEALRDAKPHLGHGKFRGWVEAECGFTIRTAQNYMRAAELTDKSETVSRLNPAAIYRLAKASTPPGCGRSRGGNARGGRDTDGANDSSSHLIGHQRAVRGPCC
jgi:hypothetical protein